MRRVDASARASPTPNCCGPRTTACDAATSVGRGAVAASCAHAGSVIAMAEERIARSAPNDETLARRSRVNRGMLLPCPDGELIAVVSLRRGRCWHSAPSPPGATVVPARRAAFATAKMLTRVAFQSGTKSKPLENNWCITLDGNNTFAGHVRLHVDGAIRAPDHI